MIFSGESHGFSERLDDVFSRRGFATYRRIRRFLTHHIVLINGVRALTGGVRINLFKDSLTIDSKPVKIKNDIFIMMNKKSGFVCSTVSEKQDEDGSRFPTVYDLLPEEFLHDSELGNLHTIGRLDADTEGLLLFTTNGDFSHRTAMPDFHIAKTYRITLQDKVDQDSQSQWIEKCSQGFFMPREWNSPGFTSKPSRLEFISENNCLLTISEGKFHQVKRMVRQLGNSVAHLERLSMGNLFLDESLEKGRWRFLSEDEIVKVLQPAPQKEPA